MGRCEIDVTKYVRNGGIENSERERERERRREKEKEREMKRERLGEGEIKGERNYGTHSVRERESTREKERYTFSFKL